MEKQARCLWFGTYGYQLPDRGVGYTTPQSPNIHLCFFWTTWWRHQMETFFTLLALCEGNPPVTGGFPSQRSVLRSFEFSLIWAWTNGLTNNGDTGELGSHPTHYDVTVTKMQYGDQHELNGRQTYSVLPTSYRKLACITTIFLYCVLQ